MQNAKDALEMAEASLSTLYDDNEEVCDECREKGPSSNCDCENPFDTDAFHDLIRCMQHAETALEEEIRDFIHEANK